MGDPASTAVATKDIVGWTVTAIGLAATYAWNFHNRWRTNRLAADLRAEAFQFDEWKAKRTVLLARLQDFEGAGARVLVLSRGAHDVNGLREELQKQGLELIVSQGALWRELARVRQEWASSAYGRIDGSESDWDNINTILGDIDGNDAGVLRARLIAIGPLILSISATVMEQIDIETASHDPNKI